MWSINNQKIVDNQSSEIVLEDTQRKIKAKYNYKNHTKRLKAQQSVSSLGLIRCNCNPTHIEFYFSNSNVILFE